MKALSLAIQKIWPMLKFSQTDRKTNRRTDQKLYAPDLSIWGHKKKSKAYLPTHSKKHGLATASTEFFTLGPRTLTLILNFDLGLKIFNLNYIF
jgi:hypothetical protein